MASYRTGIDWIFDLGTGFGFNGWTVIVDVDQIDPFCGRIHDQQLSIGDERKNEIPIHG